MDIRIQFMSLIQIRSWISLLASFSRFLVVADFETFYVVGSFFLCRFWPENSGISINNRVGSGD